MIENIKIEDILFLDIETVPQFPEYTNAPETYRLLWDKKATLLSKDGQTGEDLFQRAGIYAEFGKVICISAGLIVNKEKTPCFRVKSFAGDDEHALLTDFSDMLLKFGEKPNATLCAHNGKEFDFPYIARRMLINGIKLPSLINVAGKKPWEVKFLDTMELWKFGDFKHYTSLNLLTYIFNIPTPKDDIDGSQVADVFYRDKNIERIVTYCEKDVLAVAQLYLKYCNMPIIDTKNIEVVG